MGLGGCGWVWVCEHTLVHWLSLKGQSADTNNNHELYRSLALWTAQAILLPYVRKIVENNDLMNAAPLLELFERETAIRSYSGPKTADNLGRKVPKKISQVLERMPLSSLVGVACQRQGRGHFPRLLQKAMKDIRSGQV